MEKLENALLKINEFFSTKPEILSAYLFGSYLKGTATKFSDIDIAVLIDKEILIPQGYNYMLELQNIVSEKFKEFNFEIIPTPYMSYPLRFTAPLFGKVIYCKDHKKRLQEEKRLEMDYEELKDLYEMRYKAMIERVKKRLGVN